MTGQPTPDPFPQKPAVQQPDVNFALQAAQVGTWDLDIRQQTVWWDACCQQLYGFDRDDVVPYQQVLSYIHPDDQTRVNEAVQWALNPQSGGLYDCQFSTLGASDGHLRWLHCRGRAFFNEQGEAYRFSGIAQDVTPLVQANHQLGSSQARFTDLVLATPVATAIFTGRDMLIQQVNALMLAIWGKDNTVIGKTLHVAMPELDGQPFLAQLQHVFDTGQPFRHAEGMAEMIEKGQTKQVWFNHAYNPLYDEGGQIYGVINVAIDVTQQVLARQELEESEQFARTLFERSPIAKAVFVGEDMVIRTANQNMLAMWGKAPAVIGLPFMEAMPELRQTPQLARLRQVLRTGERFYQAAEKFDLLRYGAPYSGYFEYTYEALRSATGAIYGVICVANEVTQQVLARQKVEASEARFRSLIKDAPVAMLVYEGPAMVMVEANELMLAIFGRGDAVLGKPLLEAVPELSTTDLADQYRQVLATGQTHYQYEERILLMKQNEPYWGYYDYTYKALYDQDGTPYGVICTAVDVTAQVLARQAIEDSASRYRQLSEQLDELVQQRTAELASANQALVTTNQQLTVSNHEYALLNTQLGESNTDLLRSNQNLEQFAYIASHDLQEPLRKIQQFGDLLQSRLAKLVSGEELAYLARMQVAASRMSLLIKDLLTFSRIATSHVVAHSVWLGEVVKEALESLSVVIEESQAQIEVDELPLVEGDESQLGQLFQNLLGNALKFRRTRPDGEVVSPRIRVRSRLIDRSELPASLHPSRPADRYHLIEVIDNGIGFEEKYRDRIFQVFQRLHGKNEFAGTGVGLAIVQKVVTNHGGAITASGKPDQGATFCVYLPA